MRDGLLVHEARRFMLAEEKVLEHSWPKKKEGGGGGRLWEVKGGGV